MILSQFADDEEDVLMAAIYYFVFIFLGYFDVNFLELLSKCRAELHNVVPVGDSIDGGAGQNKLYSWILEYGADEAVHCFARL